MQQFKICKGLKVLNSTTVAPNRCPLIVLVGFVLTGSEGSLSVLKRLVHACAFLIINPKKGAQQCLRLNISSKLNYIENLCCLLNSIIFDNFLACTLKEIISQTD